MSTSNLSIGELEAKYPLYCKALKLLIKQEKTSPHGKSACKVLSKKADVGGLSSISEARHACGCSFPSKAAGLLMLKHSCPTRGNQHQ